MKTAQITHIYLPHVGGLEFYVKRVADSLDKKGIATDVLTTDMNTPKTGRKNEAKYFGTSFQVLRNPFSLGFMRHLQKNDYDILHLHSVWFLHCLVAVFFRKKARVISTIHGVYPDNLSFALKIFLQLYKPFVKYVLNKSEIVFVYSAIEEKKLKRIFKISSHKIGILPMAINIEEYQDEQREKVILFTGRLIPDKNPQLLIKAVALLNEKFRDFKVKFVGYIAPDYKKTLIDLARNLNIKNEIDFAGHLDPSVAEQRRELMNHYKKAAVFVSIGSWEGQPTRLMEAMQFKTPVIAFSAGGTEDFVLDNVNGLVITRLDEKMLADKLERILSDASLATRLGEEARKTILKSYNWDTIFEKLVEVYKK